MTDARKAALLRLLDDWEAGRLTPAMNLTNSRAMAAIRLNGWVAWNDNPPGMAYTLTPAGMAAARRVREGGGDE